MRQEEWPTHIDFELEKGIDYRIGKVKGAIFRKTRGKSPPPPDFDSSYTEKDFICWEARFSPEIDLDLSIDLYSDQLNICFGDGVAYLMVELGEFTARKRPMEEAYSLWREKCFVCMDDLLGNDLKVELRIRKGEVVGGSLFARVNGEWKGLGGGSTITGFLGNKVEREYNNIWSTKR